MKTITFEELKKQMVRLLTRENVPFNDADVLADIFHRASLRGVGHHDIHDFFMRIHHLQQGDINNMPAFTLQTGFGAMESWDGDNGLGELCCHHVTRRSMALALEHGIGLATIRNSNHFLAAAPYTEIADEEGYLTLVLSKSPGGISLPGADRNIIGNNPFGYSAGHSEDPLLFDICCAYSSYGKMGVYAKEGKEVPDYWGNDSQGNPTTDPKAILESSLYMPMGGHKGFGLAIMIELLTAIISGGNILNQKMSETGLKGEYSQTAISVDMRKLMTLEDYEDRVDEMKNIFRRLYPQIHLPGEGSGKSKKDLLEKGFFELPDELYSRLVE